MKSAYEWTLLILALSLMIQTLEYLFLQSYFREEGVWRWSEMREEFPALTSFDLFLSDKAFSKLLWIRLIFSFLLLFTFSFPVVFILCLSTLLIALRFRGSFNGGSDYMSAIMLSALSVAAWFKTEKVMTGVLWYIALQVCASYFLAGLVKIKQPLWRNGEALIRFLRSPNYNPPAILGELFKHPPTILIAAWTVMLGELLFPLVFITSGKGALFFIGGAFLFHALNAWIFGLNRFWFAWSATYPALYFAVKSFSNSP